MAWSYVLRGHSWYKPWSSAIKQVTITCALSEHHMDMPWSPYDYHMCNMWPSHLQHVTITRICGDHQKTCRYYWPCDHHMDMQWSPKDQWLLHVNHGPSHGYTMITRRPVTITCETCDHHMDMLWLPKNMLSHVKHLWYGNQ